MKTNNEGLRALTTSKERQELRAVGKKPVVKLRRTFNQKWPDGSVIKYWRVIQPGHRNNESDLSLSGLKAWGIIK